MGCLKLTYHKNTELKVIRSKKELTLKCCVKNERSKTVWKFNGKELDDATGMYYYGARYYDPRISIFVSVDPLAERTMEPYLYAGNNPIRYTDPTGMEKDDIININLQTKEVEIIKQKGDDVVNFIDENGDVKDHYTYGKEGSFSKDFNYRKGNLKDNGQEFMSLQTSNNSKAHELFEFISKNSDVEFERLRLNGYKNANSSTDVSIIGTTFEKATTAYGAFMLPYLEKEGLALKAHWHNHPSGTIRPSAYNVDNSIDFEASGDAPFARGIINRYEKAGINKPNFYIIPRGRGTITEYDGTNPYTSHKKP